MTAELGSWSSSSLLIWDCLTVSPETLALINDEYITPVLRNGHTNYHLTGRYHFLDLPHCYCPSRRHLWYVCELCRNKKVKQTHESTSGDGTCFTSTLEAPSLSASATAMATGWLYQRVTCKKLTGRQWNCTYASVFSTFTDTSSWASDEDLRLSRLGDRRRKAWIYSLLFSKVSFFGQHFSPATNTSETHAGTQMKWHTWNRAA